MRGLYIKGNRPRTLWTFVNYPQIASVTLITLKMGASLWCRVRYNIVALTGLLAGLALGILPTADTFKGFSDNIVIIVGSALVVTLAVTRSRLIESAVGKLAAYLKSTPFRVAFLVATVAIMSAVIKNIALAMILPIT